MIFLIVYDRPAGRVESLRTFSDSDRRDAETVRLDTELDLNRRRIDREVVLLEAETEAALRKTHRRYFEGVKELALSGTRATN
jgi:hypothetical protein